MKKKKNKEMRKKGFTLIELLAVIVIVAIVAGISVSVFLTVIDNSKKNASVLAMSNLREAAVLYGKEKTSSIPWNTYKDNDGNSYKYLCLTVRELIDAGYFNKQFYKKDIYKDVVKDNTFIQLSQNGNYDNLTVKMVEESNKEVCERKIVEEINPELLRFTTDDASVYSDRFFVKAGLLHDTSMLNKVEFNGVIGEQNYPCSNENGCTFNTLKSSTSYNYKICLKSKAGSGLNFSESCIAKNTTTKNLVKPSISISLSDSIDLLYNAAIYFSSENIYGGKGYYYFKSEVDGTTDKNVFACTDINNKGSSCSSSATNRVVANKWYRSNDNIVNLNTLSLREFVGKELKVEAATLDDSNNKMNYVASIKPSLTVCNISYDLDGGVNDSSNPSTYGRSNSTITLKNPSKVGYSFTGWTGSNGTSPVKDLNVNLSTCNLNYKANWKRSFTCGQVGGTTTYMGHSWYTNSNENGYCDLSLNGVVGSDSGNRYADASNDSIGVYSYIKDYSNGQDKLSAERDAGLIDRTSINTNSGNKNASNIGGYWWYDSGRVYYGTAIDTYSANDCHYFFWGGFTYDSGNESKNGLDDVSHARYCLGNVKTSYSGAVAATNTSGTKDYSNIKLTINNTIRNVSMYVNKFSYSSGNNFNRKVYYLNDDGSTWSEVSYSSKLISRGTPTKGKDGVSGCPHKKDEGYNDTSCPEVNHTTEAKSYNIRGCGQVLADGAIKKDANGDSVQLFYVTKKTRGSYYFAGGSNYIYGKNTSVRTLTAYDGGNDYNAPGSDCEKRTYYTTSGSKTVYYKYRPHIRVKI